MSEEKGEEGMTKYAVVQNAKEKIASEKAKADAEKLQKDKKSPTK